ncbi:MAG: amidohydrolase [Halieaceae bacterium]|jgi:predicted amidohydrolase YtcJ|nr:amidohydrolase [Halieaceae bacterium]
MKHVLILIAIFVAACSARVEDKAVSPALKPAARVFVNGSVYTVDDDRSWAEALAVRDGHIVAVGTNEEVEQLIGDGTEVTDLDGQMLLPGFHDSHAHLLIGIAGEQECDLLRIPTLEKVRAKLTACRNLEGFGGEGWIVGSGWAEWLWADGNPNKSLLDEFFPDRPVYLESSYGHSALANSKALELAGIHAGSEDPEDGIIMRNPESGEPSGTLRDGAMMIVQAVIPEASLKYRTNRVSAAIDYAHSLGITGLIEPGLDARLLEPVVRLAEEGRLNLRTKVSLSPIAWHPGVFGEEVFEFLESRDQWRRKGLDIDGVKIYMDGVIESGTGALLEPYTSTYSGLGPRFYSQKELDRYMVQFEKMGLQIHVHAVGDAGIRMALDAFETVRRENGPTNLRHHIVHLQLMNDDDAPRFAELNVSATFQPLWAWPDPSVTELAAPILGKERAWSMYSIGTVHRSGGRVVGGSDFFVTDMNPLLAIEVALTRQNPYENSGPILGEDERVDLATMIEAYTINGAYLMSLDDKQGSIEVGKRADFVILDRNLFGISSSEISDVQVVTTVFNGKDVYGVP